jgi:hypothetical protein
MRSVEKPLLLMFIFASFCVGTLAQESAWKEYVPEDETFSALVPCIPTSETETDPKTKQVSNQHTCMTSSIVFLVRQDKDVKGVSSDSKANLDSFCKGFMQGLGGELISQRDITLGKYPGRELVVRLVVKGQELRGKVRIYFVGNTAYTAGALALAAAAGEADIDKFLDSFSLK